MATVDITPADLTSAGVTLTKTTPTSGDDWKVLNDGRTYVVVENGATAANLTIATPVQVDGLDVSSRVVAVAANTTVIAGPFSPAIYNDGDGEMTLTLDSVANVKLAAFRV